jgi:hypothetical protein
MTRLDPQGKITNQNSKSLDPAHAVDTVAFAEAALGAVLTIALAEGRHGVVRALSAQHASVGVRRELAGLDEACSDHGRRPERTG